MEQNKRNKIVQILLWVLEGIVVGFGAILPGISGGTLCVAFGMYRPIIDLLADLRGGLKKYWLMLGSFLVGMAIGFVGLSGLAAWLLEKNTALLTCVFIGFILGTLPELWQEAGAQGRRRGSFVAMALSFALMLGVLFLLRSNLNVTIQPGIPGYLFCGLLWGLSFIVPGLSSSSLLLFFGLYQPMLDGIAHLSLPVIIPMGIAMLACLLLLSKVMDMAYKKFYAIVSHSVIGIVIATTVMILPSFQVQALTIFFYILAILGGAALSFLFTRLCAKIKEKYGE